MPFPCPSPKGTNFAGLYLNRAGDLVDRNGALWGRRGTMAHDSLPESIRAPRVPSASDDAEHRVGMLRHTLRGYGLDDELCDEACEIARREIAGEPVEDELVHSGPGAMGGRLNPATRREPDEKFYKTPARFSERPALGTKSGERRGSSVISEQEYRSSPASDSSLLDELGVTRVKAGVPGSGQFDPAPPLTAKDRKIARDSVPDFEADRNFREMFPGAPEFGEWLPRRW